MGRAVIAAARAAGHPDHAARRLLPARRHRALPRPRRRRVGRARRRARRARPAARSARRSTASARSTRTPPRVVAEWAGGPAAARARLRAAQRERGVPRRARRARRPALLADAGALGERFTAVHATHLTDEDVALLGGAGATVCLCPTTERDLADGIGPAARAAPTRARALAVGSDSQAVIDLFEEARAIELDERLATGVRGAPPRAATCCAPRRADGHAALGWPEAGAIEPGALADLVSVVARRRPARRARRRSTRSRPPSSPPTAPDVRDVMVGGALDRPRRRARAHRRRRPSCARRRCA